MTNGFDDRQKVSKQNMDKSMESFGALSKGVQAIAVETVDFSKKSFEDGAAHLERLLGVRTLDRAIEVQSEYVKTAYESAVNQTTKMGELYAGLTKDVLKPFEGIFPATAR